jgi:hypothetical protein
MIKIIYVIGKIKYFIFSISRETAPYIEIKWCSGDMFWGLYDLG